ncbi:hypothetical protein VTN77DRAFT_7187 [Rasamsonia byssochlamydoides]|uniref:uncharacterized protein n=1 Tax=Rasamsonia byssochlamydoides TaxID=89139 RepID=UPI0037445E31
MCRVSKFLLGYAAAQRRRDRQFNSGIHQATIYASMHVCSTSATSALLLIDSDMWLTHRLLRFGALSSQCFQAPRQTPPSLPRLLVPDVDEMPSAR